MALSKIPKSPVSKNMVSANSAKSHAGSFYEIEILAIIGLTIIVTYTMFTQEMKKDCLNSFVTAVLFYTLY